MPELLKVNAQALVSVVDLFDGFRCVVVDDYLENPDALVAYAKNNAASFSGRVNNGYPGIELALDDECIRGVRDNLMRSIRHFFSGGNVLTDSYARLALVTKRPEDLTPKQRLCHVDVPAGVSGAGVTIASVMYLFHEVLLGGTGFYRPREGVRREDLARDMAAGSMFRLMARYAFFRRPPVYMTNSCEFYELRHVVEPRFNRIVFYRGDMYHSGHIVRPDLLSAEPEQGRLTMNYFFRCSST